MVARGEGQSTWVLNCSLGSAVGCLMRRLKRQAGETPNHEFTRDHEKQGKSDQDR